MPFVQRIIEPKFLSRTSLFNTDGKARVTDDELIAVTNNTLANALRQLASLVLVANDIFVELAKELQTVTQRTDALKNHVESLEEEVFTFDPKKVTVPVSDISAFSLIRNHYESKHGFEANLFNASSRSISVQALYDASTKTPVSIIRQLDRLRQDGYRSSRFFACTPVLGAKLKGIKKKVNLEIESRMPAAVEQLRRWTSAEALGDITIAPDCSNRVASNISITDANITNRSSASRDEGVDHQLPSPQEQVHVIALKFPAEIVAIDVTGRYFNKMSIQRRSFLHKNVLNCTDGIDVTSSKTKERKSRNRRRTTLAGTDQKEIETAIIAREEPSLADNDEYVPRSKSSDLLRSSFKKETSVENRRSHFYSLKQWGKDRLRMMNKLPGSSHKKEISENDEVDLNLYEKVNVKRKKNINKDKRMSQDNKLSHTSLEKSTEGNNPILIPLSANTNPLVKLRESSIQRRLRRSRNFKDEPHSSSGNWSASSESGRASIDSETTHPKSTSNATSVNSLNVPNSITSRSKFNINTSRSNSITSEETITPDIHDFPEDGETSSIYSCDTEGYYTSFHMDSGLKTLKEEDAPVTPLHSTTAFSSNTIISAENEYELFGKGSTSTTASSAGTVCTTLQASASNRSLLIAPAVPERKSSLSKMTHNDNFRKNSLENEFISEKTGTVKRSPANNKSIVTTLKHQQSSGDMSPDSGHNTSSSPIESTNSPSGIRSCSEFEFSECSDMEGSDRIERIRVKTTINSSRIPSMCVITPPHSDDESTKSVTSKKNILKNNFVGEIQVTSEKDWKNNNQLHIRSKPIETDLDNLEYFNLTNVEPLTTQETQVELNAMSDYLAIEAVDNYNNDLENANISSALNTAKLPLSIGSVGIKEEIQVHTHSVLKGTLLPYNNVLGQIKLKYQDIPKEQIDVKHISNFPDDFGDYVTITDIKNNNQNILSHIGTTFETNFNEEYVSLNELPCGNIENQEKSVDTYNSLDGTRKQGARVTLNAEGKVVYTSDSLKRRKVSHSTFEPGPYRKERTTPGHIPLNEMPNVMEYLTHCKDQKLIKNDLPSRSSSPQLEKLIIRATSSVTSPIAEKVRVPPSTIVTPNSRPLPQNANSICGAYVHMQDDRVYSDSSYEKEKVHSPSEHPSVCKNLKMQSHAYEDIYLRTNNVVRNNTQKNSTSSTPSTKQLQSVLNYNFEALAISDNAIFLPNDACSLRHNYSLKEIEKESELFSKKLLRKKLLGKPVPLPQVECSVSTANVVASSTNHLLSTLPTIQSGYSYNQIIRSGNSRIDSTTESEKFYNSLKISPIDPRNFGEFKSSTPSTKYHQEIKSAVNLTNILVSPKKSTMSTEELNVIIHKGKRKLNVESIDNNSKILPTPINNKAFERSTKSVEAGYLGNNPHSRFSWSPSDGEYVEYNTNIDKLSPSHQAESKQSGICTNRKTNSQISRLDFKKLLLRQNIKTSITPSSNTRLSAVEQLKLSKQTTPNNRTRPEIDIIQLSKSPKKMYNRKFTKSNDNDGKQRSKQKLMSPKSQWKFVNPRTDVLSSTILEDFGENENSSSLINENSILLTTRKLDFNFKDKDDFSSTVSNIDLNSTSKPVLQQNDFSINLIGDNFAYKSLSAIPISQLTTSQKGKFSNSSQFSPGVSDYDSHNTSNIIESTCSSLPTLETAF